VEVIMSAGDGTADQRVRPAADIAARLAAACAAAALYALWVRPRLLTWGATREEITRGYPGDDLIPDADRAAFTMATTLPAAPEKVWAWLVQMGGDRAGFYSWDRLDHHGEPSADRIVPEWQSLQQGQRLNSEPSGKNWMIVEVVEPDRTLVLRSTTALPSCRSFDPRTAPLPRVYLDGIWGFYLRSAPGAQTRLVARTRGRSRPQPVMGAVGLVLLQPLHFIMQTRQFRNLRARVSAQARAGRPPGTRRLGSVGL
jgi:hypothetical protein